MATKHAGKKYPVKGRDRMTFLNTKLNDAELEKFHAWFAEEHKAAAALIKVYHRGYKFSTSWYADGEIFIATLFPHADLEENQGYGLSSRSKDWYKAQMMCVYKTVVMSDFDWSIFDRNPDDEG